MVDAKKYDRCGKFLRKKPKPREKQAVNMLEVLKFKQKIKGDYTYGFICY